MSTIDLICEACGEPNPPGTQFCTNCNTFLAWDRSAPPGTSGPKPDQGSRLPPPTKQADTTPTATVADPQPVQVETTTAYSDTSYPDTRYPDTDEPTSEVSCPACGRVNPTSRRFCSHCGYSLGAGEYADSYASGGWSAASDAARDRAARRAYRRSLPPLYRWRRVLIAILLLALVAAVPLLLRQGPVRLLKDGWYTLNRRYVTVPGVQARVEPANATAAGSDPAALVDGSVREWTGVWAPSQESACGPAGNTGVIVLTFAPTRIRQIQIVPGLDQSNPQRNLQPLPKTLGIAFDDGVCHPVTLTNAPTQPAINLDSGKPTTSVRIGIGSAYPAGPDAQPLISLTEVILKSFPS